MRAVYVPYEPKAWETFFKGQTGAGLGGFSGVRYQRGAGIGNIFRGLFRTLLPLAKSAGKSIGKQALATGAQVALDTLDGQNIGEAFEARGKEAATNLIKKGAGRLNRGAGTQNKKRPPQQRGVRKTSQSGKGIGHRRKSRKVTTMSIKGKKPIKKQRRSDQFGVYYM